MGNLVPEKGEVPLPNHDVAGPPMDAPTLASNEVFLLTTQFRLLGFPGPRGSCFILDDGC